MISEYVIDKSILNSSDARKLEKDAAELQETYFSGATLVKGEDSYSISGPSDLLQNFNRFRQKRSRYSAI